MVHFGKMEGAESTVFVDLCSENGRFGGVVEWFQLGGTFEVRGFVEKVHG
jgi:hypothetical protein